MSKQLYLTEINSSQLFDEYLHKLGAQMPHVAKRGQSWEHRSGDRVLAQVRCEEEGNPRYFIRASSICSNH
ncbi:hypothetical protein [Dongshaea marina]|uniref:hypothetical protein n=1 Tax=Dongshaea marina TaxID=2047966 RepID=UPI000D3EC46B|nr:hypothetical protein [Dongshaea marina]